MTPAFSQNINPKIEESSTSCLVAPQGFKDRLLREHLILIYYDLFEKKSIFAIVAQSTFRMLLNNEISILTKFRQLTFFAISVCDNLVIFQDLKVKISVLKKAINWMVKM